MVQLTKIQIKRLVRNQKDYKASINPTIEDINDIMGLQTKKQLLEIHSSLLSRGLYVQIKDNKNMGINNLKTFMKTLILIDKTLNFSNIDLSNQLILEKNLNTETNLNNNERIAIKEYKKITRKSNLEMTNKANKFNNAVEDLEAKTQTSKTTLLDKEYIKIKKDTFDSMKQVIEETKNIAKTQLK